MWKTDPSKKLKFVYPHPSPKRNDPHKKNSKWGRKNNFQISISCCYTKLAMIKWINVRISGKNQWKFYLYTLSRTYIVKKALTDHYVFHLTLLSLSGPGNHKINNININKITGDQVWKNCRARGLIGPWNEFYIITKVISYIK